MASGDSVQQIKERLSIVDVVSSYVELHQAGKHFKGKSPFTNEKTPSFYVSPDRGVYYCFSSSQGGDMFTFVQTMEGVDFRGALKILADKAGVELVPEDPKKRTDRERQYDVLEEATKFFESQFMHTAQVQAYLEDRGVLAQTRAKWRLGYAPDEWRELKIHLEAKQYEKEAILKAGLIKGANAGKEPYDVFRNRVMFPICDASGRVVAYSGRILSKDNDAPKYVNSPETELFNKSEILYGYDKAKNGIRSFDFSLIVEGQFDVVLAHQAGYTNAVAVSGTALTAHHVMLLQRISNRVVLALDADRAGISAVKRAAELMLARGMDVKVAKMPAGDDPADMIKRDPHEFKKVIGSATHVVEYLLDVLQEQKKDDRSFKLHVREEILPYVARIPNRIDQEHFQNLIAQRLQTTKDAIAFEVGRILERVNERTTSPGGNQPTQQSEPVASEERSATTVSVRKQELIHYLAVIHEQLSSEMANTLAKTYTDILDRTIPETIESLDSQALSKLTFTIEQMLTQMTERELREDLVDKLTELTNLMRKEELGALRRALQDAEQSGDDTSVQNIMQRIAAVQTRHPTPYDATIFGDA